MCGDVVTSSSGGGGSGGGGGGVSGSKITEIKASGRSVALSGCSEEDWLVVKSGRGRGRGGQAPRIRLIKASVGEANAYHAHGQKHKTLVQGHVTHRHFTTHALMGATMHLRARWSRDRVLVCRATRSGLEEDAVPWDYIYLPLPATYRKHARPLRPVSLAIPCRPNLYISTSGYMDTYIITIIHSPSTVLPSPPRAHKNSLPPSLSALPVASFSVICSCRYTNIPANNNLHHAFPNRR
ncbi:hypothetical protein P280DRAFT_315550 [Massarina eburnea CBS 473.64]|uniref:Uncharacterized protein n=1 Tax=Massarina eburnea CBS 473.64 TaxID=1395130 RepID=A0A6A6S522_9PLEO|nr:hypothetical protein P280DRAFT_315550 [Massarina eburnea CBS 473.64]